MESARTRGRYGHRDATMILIAFRHGLRPAEVCALRWDMIDLGPGLLHVRRVKNGTPSVQPLGGGELRALRRLKREEIESRFGRTEICYQGNTSHQTCHRPAEWEIWNIDPQTD